MPENTIYVQQENDDGEKIYVEITAETDVDLPEAIVEKSPHYVKLADRQKKTVRESRKRKTRYQSAEASLAAYDNKDSDNDDDGQDADTSDEDANTTPATPQPTSIEEITAAVLKQVQETQENETRIRNEKEKEVDTLMQEHKLTGVEGVKEALVSGDMKEVAAIMGRQKYKFDEDVGGETSVFDNIDDFMKRVDAKVGFIPSKDT